MLDFIQLIYHTTLCWISVKILEKLFKAFKTFLLPNILGECDLIKKYGSWAVITGSTDGIGKEFAKELARRGMNIVLISRSAEKLEQTASEIENEFKVKTKFIITDFGDGPDVFKHIKTELENIPVAVLVNNVAMILSRPYYIDEMPTKLIWRQMNVNIATTVMMTNLILPQMKERKKGAIINISSGSESTPLPFGGLYSSSKAFSQHFTNQLQYETASFGITVQLLSPHFIKTNMTRGLRNIHKSDSIWVPDSQTYARHALKTLGFSNHTCGYWPHGLLSWLSEMIPLKIRLQLVGRSLTPLRKKYEKKLKWAISNSSKEEVHDEEHIN